MKKMKFTTLMMALIAGTILLFTSCDELGEQFAEEFSISLDTDYYNFELEILPTPAGEKVFSEDVFPDDIDSLIEANSSGDDQLKSAYVKEAYVAFKDENTDKNFNAFESIIALVYHDELVDTLAWTGDIPEDVQKVTFQVTDKDVSEYIEEDVYTFQVKGVLKEDVTDTLDIEGKIRYDLKIGV